MAIRQILHYPDPRLRTKAAPVSQFDDDLNGLIEDMRDTMYAAPGIGLAATQIDVHLQVIVIDISPDKSDFRVLINPQIIEKSGQTEGEEGCLSVPDIFDMVPRAERIQVRTLTPAGETLEYEARGLLAICIQHEIDHLAGKVFVDYLSPLKQQRIAKKLQKRERQRL